MGRIGAEERIVAWDEHDQIAQILAFRIAGIHVEVCDEGSTRNRRSTDRDLLRAAWIGTEYLLLAGRARIVNNRSTDTRVGGA